MTSTKNCVGSLRYADVIPYEMDRVLRVRSTVVFTLAILAASNIAEASGTRVVDGDTLELNGVVYRLHGIDAPEAGQTCKRQDGKPWPCGKSAIQQLENLVIGSNVVCDDRGADGYGRTIGVCTVDGRDINAELVSMGLAWAFRKYSTDYAGIEDQARASGVGIWQGEAVPAWIYREQRWSDAQAQAPQGCPIKGNISENGQIYHAPWSPWYTRTKINLSKGEKWFCTEAEAIAAGWRAPYWGR